MRFYVIFEGTDTGVYDSCSLCRKVVYGCPNNSFQSYSTYDEAVVAWEVYCEFHGYTKRFFQDRLLQPKHMKPVVQKTLSSSNNYYVGSTSEHTSVELSNANYFQVDEEIYEWERLREYS
jgi:viroplasmin and RNaseH domain-containing protein